MKWLRYRIRTVPDAEDIIVSELLSLGLAGAQIEDNVPLTAAEKEQIYTYDASDPTDDGIAYISCYAECTEDSTVSIFDDAFFGEGMRRQVPADDLRKRMEEALSRIRENMDIGDGTLDVSVMDDTAWKDNWKQFFHSFYIDDVFIIPSWEAEGAQQKPPGASPGNVPGAATRYTLRIDPGCAFGTGAHETTQLAIRAVRKAVETHPDASVLDIGTGSGILAILSLMFGAQKAIGVDVDAFVQEAVKQNTAANHTDPARFALRIGNLIEDQSLREEIKTLSPAGAGYDIVIANILPVVLAPLTPFVPGFLKEDGIYIMSGILCEKEDMMRGVLAQSGFAVREITRQGEWCSIVSVKAGRG